MFEHPVFELADGFQKQIDLSSVVQKQAVCVF
jgi:hypothetical protein